MDLKKLKELLKIVAQSDVAEVEFDEDGTKVTIRKEAPTVTIQPPAGYFSPPAGYYPPPAPVPVVPQAPVQAPAAPAASSPTPGTESPATAGPSEGAADEPVADETVVKAPIVGTFYVAPSPGADPYVTVGSSVTPGNVLCIIEAMKLMNEIESEVSGTVKSVLVEDGEPVEYDQPLFVIQTG